MGIYVSGGTGGYHAGERHLVITNTTTPKNGSATAIVHCHGRNGALSDLGAGSAELSQQVQSQVFKKALWRAAQLGIPVIGIDGGGPALWGNATSRARVLEAHAWMVTNFGVHPDRLLLSGVSMGSITALGVTHANTSLIKGVVCFFPALDMDSPTFSSYVPEMETAYGGSVALAAAKPTYNPIEYASTFSTPSFLLYSTGDTITLPGPVDTFQAAATSCTKRAIAGAPAHVEGPINDTDVAAVTDFLTANK